MLRFSVALVFVFCGALGISYWLAIGRHGSPLLEVESPEVHIGIVQPGEFKSVEIPLRNTGTGILQIQDVSASCNCLAASIDKRVLKPGESLTLTAKVQGSRSPRNRVVISIASNDARSRLHSIAIAFFGRDGVWASREAISFGYVGDGEELSRLVMVDSHSQILCEDLGVSGDASFSESFKWSVGSPTKNGLPCSISVLPGAPYGYLDGRITFCDSESRSTSVTVTAMKQCPEIEFCKPIVLRNVAGILEGQSTVRIASNAAASPISLTLISQNNAEISIIAQGRDHIVRCRVTDNGSLPSACTVELRREGITRQLRIPVIIAED